MRKIFLLFAFVFLLSFVSGQQLIENVSSGDNDDTGFSQTTFTAQTFTIGTQTNDLEYELDLVSIKIYNSTALGNINNINAMIQNVNSSGAPNGTIVAFNFTLGSSLITQTSPNGTFVNITFPSGALLKPSTTYALVMNASASGSDLVRWRSINPSTVYSGGQMWTSTNNGTSWSPQTRDFLFEVWGVPSQISVTLDSPANGFNSATNNVTFIATSSVSATHNLTNATYNIWYSNGTLVNQTLVSISGTTNQTTLNIANFNFGNYIWNVEACAENSNTICGVAPSNFSFQVSLFDIGTPIFNSSVYETDRQNFTLPISTNEEILAVNARLYYNNSNYLSETNCISGSCNISNRIDIPLVSSGETIQYSFFWNISVFDGSSVISETSDTFYQNVTRIHLEQCGAISDKTLNFTASLEQNLTRVIPFSFGGTFDYWLGEGDVKRNVSISNSSATEIDICFSPTSRTMFTDAEIDYSFENENLTLSSRKYFFQEASLTSTLQHINLLLLDAEDATTFILKVLDNTVQPIEGALVNILRYYPSEGIYRTVQIAKTDENGLSAGFYEIETVTYKHIITKDGEVLLDTGAGGVVVGQSTPFTLTFTIGDTVVTPWSYLDENSSILTTLDYNSTNQLVTFSFIDTTGASSFGRLYVYEESLQNQTLTTICDTSLSGFSSGTITCNMTGYSGNFVAKGFVINEDNLQKIINFIVTTAREIFDETGAFLGWIIILTVAMSVLWNPSVGVVLIDCAIILVGVTGLLIFSPVAYFSIIGVSVLLLIMFKT